MYGRAALERNEALLGVALRTSRVGSTHLYFDRRRALLAWAAIADPNVTG